MASYIPGYDEERFASTVSQNFICSICFNVLRDPVLCPRNHHCFCRGCITKHLENSQRCPTCADELTVETLAEPQRMVKDILNELKIHCIYNNRGCQEIVQLQHIDQHEATCGFAPAVCTNQGCGATLNQRDLIHHESEVCEFRKLKCHSCGETTKTLADMEKRIGNMESNMAKKEHIVTMETDIRNIQAKMANVEKNVASMGTKITNVERSMEKNTAVMEGNLEAVNKEVRGLKTALIEGFDEMKDVLVKMEEMKDANRRNAPSGDRENIIVAAGHRTDSVEMFNWRQRTWSPLQSMLKSRWGATSFVYNKVPPYTVKTLSGMPEPRLCHCMEIFDDSLLIVGGRTTGRCNDNLSSVVLYDIKKNECKQLAPLPYEVSLMATVRWGGNIVVIGGIDKQGNRLDTVIIYNVKTEQSHMLPSMRCKRGACTAVVIGNNIVVLGGVDERGHNLKSVEAFNFESYIWQELPGMSQARWLHTAVVVGTL